MDLIGQYLLFLAGLVILAVGAELMVRGATRLALSLGVSTLVVGLTVVAYGTSFPELVVAVMAAAKKAPALVYGNVIGSNIINLSLILGFCAMLRPIPYEKGLFKRELPLLLVVYVLLLLFSMDGRLLRFEGVLLLAIFVIYIALMTQRALRGEEQIHVAEACPVPEKRMASNIVGYLVMLLLGFVGLYLGARFMVDSAVTLARHWGVSERIIGLTIVAVGTSLPELASGIVASIRRQSGLVIGNLLGSNIFNILLVLGTGAAISPIGFSMGEALLDFGFMFGFTVALYPFMAAGRSLGRWSGMIFLAAYIVFLLLLIF